ncbi:MAG: hypothetical protein AB1330_01780 [Bacillota bacterium]
MFNVSLPPFQDAQDEKEWLRIVCRDYSQLSEEKIAELWNMARQTVSRMGDVFWDADDYEQCNYCHLAEDCPNSKGGYPIDPGRCCDIWYGNCPGERMLNLVAAQVLESLIAVYIGSSKSGKAGGEKCPFDGNGVCRATCCWSSENCGSRDKNGNPMYEWLLKRE